MLEYRDIFVLPYISDMIQFLLVSRLMRELVNVLIMVCPNPQRHAKGRLSSTNSARMPPKNSGKFVINKKFNEGQGITQLWSNHTWDENMYQEKKNPLW